RLDPRPGDPIMISMFRKTLPAALIVGAAAASPGAAQWDDDCDHRRTLSLDLDARDISLLDVRSGAGTLEIRGGDGSDIRVEAVLCADDEDVFDRLDVSLSSRGSRAELRDRFPETRGWGGNARIDLEVTVPRGLDTRVEDGSGGVRIEGVGSLELADGSGSLFVRDVRGDLRLEDGSGSVEVRDVEGSARLRDGSGEITIVGVERGVEIRDGSGRARIEEVGGDVEVLDKGQGSVVVRDVSGDLRVEGTRRERISYQDVRGTVDLPPERRKRRRGG
ncbi:MAG: DUF4097 domain-containing protein, partial [Gemmatimonadetes bacterium]|nr:DUF4097 domain-containing protein [Gemmatimonadota bacterium]